jgi:hypothetical protein
MSLTHTHTHTHVLQTSSLAPQSRTPTCTRDCLPTHLLDTRGCHTSFFPSLENGKWRRGTISLNVGGPIFGDWRMNKTSSPPWVKNGQWRKLLVRRFHRKTILHSPFSTYHKGLSHFLHEEAILLAPLLPHSPFSHSPRRCDNPYCLPCDSKLFYHNTHQVLLSTNSACSAMALQSTFNVGVHRWHPKCAWKFEKNSSNTVM